MSRKLFPLLHELGRRQVGLLLGVLLGSLSCSSQENVGRELRVFAAASLSESFSALAAAFGAEQSQVRVRIHTSGTSQLVLQLREGARADVFAAADQASMNSLLEHLQEDASEDSLAATPQLFARNELAILVRAGNPLGITSLSQLSKPELRFAMAGPHVPAGRYAREALKRADVSANSRSDEASVRGVVQKVLLGELDAGIVYTTDRRKDDTELELVPIPLAYQPEIHYPIVALPHSEHPDLAVAFVQFVLSDSGQSILRAHGFGAAR